MSDSVVLNRLCELFDVALMPWCKSGELRPVMFSFRRARPEVFEGEPGDEEPERYAYTIDPQRWPSLGLHAARHPCLAFVMEGEVDITVGQVYPPSAAHVMATGISNLRAVPLKRRDVLVIPSGTPISNARDSLWRRDGELQPNSQVLWFRAHPLGGLLQLSYVEAGVHKQTATIYVKELALFPQTEVLVACLQKDTPASDETLQCCLRTLLLLLEQGLPSGRLLVDDGSTATVRAEEIEGHLLGRKYGDNEVVVQRACAYIRSQAAHNITLEAIAGHAAISAPSLTRIFRQELKSSVMQYVAKYRMEEVKNMLLQTNFSVAEIAEMSGFERPQHLSRMFIRVVGMPPTEYRRSHSGIRYLS